MMNRHIEEQWKPTLNINAGGEGLKLSEEFQVPEEFWTTYSIKHEPQPYNISSFDQIGI